MEVLTQPNSIRSAVKKLLRDPTDERVVAVAYVGADALSFLSAPTGLKVYCWPQAGGTNPVAVEELVRAGVKVQFVNRLHAKVYWSRSRGALIGSANLTANALGEHALQEAAVLVPPGAFDMRSFTKSMALVPDFAAALKRLHEAHVRFWQRNRAHHTAVATSNKLPLFSQWVAERRPEWRLGWYEDYVNNAPRDALDELENETGSRKHATFIGVKRKSDLRAGVFTLSFRIRETVDALKLSVFEWWAPEIVVHTETTSWKDWPYIWFARVRIPVGTSPPFDIREVRFRRALEATILELGGLKWLYRSSLKPSRGFLECLAGHYSASES